MEVRAAKLSGHEIYVSLRRSILLLDLEPGTLISENALSEEFSVSRTTIRRALQRLENEQLVEIVPKRGTFVSKLDMNRWKDVLYIRYLVESDVLDSLCTCYSGATELALHNSLEKQFTILGKEPFDAFEFFSEDNDFHRIIFNAVNLGGCWEIILEHMTEAIRCRMLGYILTGSLFDLYEEHVQIVQALALRDQASIRRILQYHLTGYLPRIFGDEMNRLSEYYKNRFIE